VQPGNIGDARWRWIQTLALLDVGTIHGRSDDADQDFTRARCRNGALACREDFRSTESGDLYGPHDFRMAPAPMGAFARPIMVVGQRRSWPARLSQCERSFIPLRSCRAAAAKVSSA